MFAEVVDLLLPRRCLGCGQPGRGLCPSCAYPQPRCRLLADVGVVHAAGSYRGPLGAGILHFKDRRRRDLLAPLAAALRASVEAAVAGSGNDRCVVLVPVPSTARAAAQRGGDHMRRIAAAAAAGCAVGAASASEVRVVGALRARPGRADASVLGAAERRASITGNFGCVAPMPVGVSALVVDDVLTTGATLQEAVRTLRRGGWTVDGAAVIAITPAPRRARRR